MTDGRTKALTAEEFSKMVRARHAVDFDKFGQLYHHIQELIQRSRSLESPYKRSQDMLFLQAFKGMQAAGYLCELALVEDAATVARRILEVAMRMMWLHAKDKDDGVRDERVDDFLATLWHEWKPHSKSLDSQERLAYESIYARASQRWPDPKQPPLLKFKKMFREAGAEDLYENDYAFLSRIAHGTTPMLVRTYASPNIQVHDDAFVPAVLRAVRRSVLMCSIIWNDTFELTDGAHLDALGKELLTS